MSHGHITATYIDTSVNTYVKKILHDLSVNHFHTLGKLFHVDSDKYQHHRQNNTFIYLCGYDDFIFPNALIPVHSNKSYPPLLNIYDSLIIVPKDIDQMYYYISQIVHDTCIVTHSLDHAFCGSVGIGSGHKNYFGYKGILPIMDIEPRKVVYNKGLPNRDKFLVFPPVHSSPENPSRLRVIYKFTPTPESNVYDVPDIGKVIMNPPANDEPWYGSQVIVLFDHGFIPPQISTQDIDDSTGISVSAFENVGTYLDDHE